MKTTPRKRHAFGMYCEAQVDRWLEPLAWLPVVKNMRYPGGEIDRIYCREGSYLHFCLVESKGLLVSSRGDIEALFWDWGLKKFVKQRQLRRLMSVYSHWQLKQENRSVFDFRIMIVLVFRDFKPDSAVVAKLERVGYRYAKIDEEVAILSFKPDFIGSGNCVGSLQVRN